VLNFLCSVNYFLSCWYKRSELGIRVAVFFAAATVSGAFGGLLAAGISSVPHPRGRPAWAWIFIIEGAATIVLGALSFWLVQDFPDSATFLSEPERAHVVRRLQADGQFSAAGEGLRARAVWEAIRAPRTWLCMLFFVGSDMPLYAFSLFLPSIIKEVWKTPASWYSAGPLITVLARLHVNASESPYRACLRLCVHRHCPRWMDRRQEAATRVFTHVCTGPSLKAISVSDVFQAVS
jgi:MFS family permease